MREEGQTFQASRTPVKCLVHAFIVFSFRTIVILDVLEIRHSSSLAMLRHKMQMSCTVYEAERVFLPLISG